MLIFKPMSVGIASKCVIIFLFFKTDMRGSVKPHGRLVVWALPVVMQDSKFGYIGGHPAPVGAGLYRGNPSTSLMASPRRVRRDYTPNTLRGNDIVRHSK